MPTFGLKPKKTQNLNALLAWLTSKLIRDANTTSNDEREFIYEPPADQFIFTKNNRDEWVCIGGPSGYFFPSPLEIAEEEAKTAKQLNKTMRTELLKHSRIAEQRSHDLDEAKAEIGRLHRRIQRLEGDLEKSLGTGPKSWTSRMLPIQRNLASSLRTTFRLCRRSSRLADKPLVPFD